MTTVSAKISSGSQTPNPDLEISIFQENNGALRFEVRSGSPDAGINALQMFSGPLPTAPEKFLYHLFKDIENLPLDTEEHRQVVENKLAAKGWAIWDLFPRDLQELLWKRRRQALSLLIQSDNPYIPWEIAKLQSRNRDGRTVPGPFLCEAFAVTQWVRGHPHQICLPIQKLALVAPRTPWLNGAAEEQKEIRTLAEHYGREVTDIEPTFPSVRQAMISGVYDGWHFAGHCAMVSDDANRWHIELEAPPNLCPEDLLGETKNLGLAKPFVFLNGCATGRGGLTLTGPGGWSHSFLKAKAGAFIGTYWAVADSKSRELAKAVYEGLFEGLPIGEAFRRARLHLHKEYGGDPTWLAYMVLAHPLASSTQASGESFRGNDRKPSHLSVPTLQWRRNADPSGSLLCAQHGIVPFHRRDKELGDLRAWCLDPSPVKVRLYTGPGGMGKTRLALEAALKMQEEGWWTGFVTSEALRSPEPTWKALTRPDAKLLLIVDYAETNRPFLTYALREMYRIERGHVRLILLARAALDWWEHLKSERDGVGELLTGPVTSRYSLQPLADSIDARAVSYSIAAEAFSQRLQIHPPETPDDLAADYFQRVLLLHMKALIDLEGLERAKGEDGILDRILAREKNYWETLAVAKGIPPEIVPGIGRAMAVITLGGGARGETDAIEALRALRFFADQPAAVLTAVARLLHECYPGERWIEPLLPDLLGEHLVQRELETGADELLDLLLGPRSGS